MKGIVRQADRVAIWHEPMAPRAFYTLAEVEEERRTARELGHAGYNRRLAKEDAQIIKFPDKKPHNTEVSFEELPDHDWTQHDLGDREHWEEENAFRQFDAALADYGITPPDMKSMENTGQELGTHHAQVWNNPQNNENWLVKPAPNSAKFLADGDVAANAIQQYSGLHTPPTFKTKVGNKPASMQLMIPGAKDAYPDKQFDPEKVPDHDLMTIQKHHALDWLIGNHDSHGGQFIRDPQGQLIGIDKGQAFKHYNQDRLHWNYHPNAAYDEKEPVYNTLYRNFAQGGRQMFDPREGELGQFIQHLQDIPDTDFLETLHPYAHGAAQAGQLGLMHDNGYTGHGPQRFAPNDTTTFLEHALQRKKNLMADLADLHDRAMAHRMTGTKIAKIAVAPKPEELHDEGETLGTNQRAKVYSDPQGRWLIKHPEEGNEFMVPLDLATSQLQKRVGLEAPETYAVPMNGNLAAVSKMYHGAEHPWEVPPSLSDLSPEDLETIQKHQALDWMIGNHDAHVGNWIRTRDGQLVGIDKGQAAKYFGRDKLDPHFHPNYYAREPIYNNLWREHAAGLGEMNNPREGAVGEFVQKLQGIPDHELKGMFAPYAHAAAQAGQLATGGDPDHMPGRKLAEPKFPANDPDSFLNAMVDRKNNLHNDLGGLYDKANKSRAQQQRAQPQPVMPEEMEDIGVHQGSVHREGHLGGLLDMGMGLLTQGLGNALKPLTTPKLPTMPDAPKAPATPGNPTSAPGPNKIISPLTLPGFNGIPFRPPSFSSPSMPGGATPSSQPGTTTTTPSSGGGSTPPSNYNPSAGVDQWTPHIQEALRRNGLPVTPDYVNRVKKQMQTESSGNPKAINNSDINAINGHPSQGLMQTIPSTFQQYHLPGDSSDITDPQANLDSAIGYAKSRYGPTLMDSSGNGIGSGHGY